MIPAVRKTISQLAHKPQKLFLIDSLGAMLTAFFLFVVLKNFNEYFGMPQKILTYLSVIAAFFCIYSATCFFLLKKLDNIHWNNKCCQLALCYLDNWISNHLLPHAYPSRDNVFFGRNSNCLWTCLY